MPTVLLGSIGFSAWEVWKLNPSLLWVAVLCAVTSALVLFVTVEFVANLKVEESVKALEDLSARIRLLNEASGEIESNLQSLEHALTQLPESMTMDKEALMQEVSTRLRTVVGDTMVDVERLALELRSKLGTSYYSSLWNSLPYSGRFEEFDSRLKVLYFDAIRSGNYSKVNAKLKAKTKV
jgi:hypothetical protein